ncbi:hypothetical protein PHYBOEH_004474 [Phytophthora boehmeriae]|uniref:Uncharacterized protein n=1 Tax=Phytophthora boehmeriae TaxID=109152 RepID=A0A8T1WLY7_9STRA|nr:hypothetical protein PHYBOEH_004474 [Phytophthora boehmeriae]
MTAHEQVQADLEVSLPQEISSKPNSKVINPQLDAPKQAVLFNYSNATHTAWNWICWSGAKAFDGMEFAGEVIADFFGLTQSKYQWVLDAQKRDEEEKQLRRLEARQRRQLYLEQLLEEEQRKLQELEMGMSEGGAESTQIPESCTL